MTSHGSHSSLSETRRLTDVSRPCQSRVRPPSTTLESPMVESSFSPLAGGTAQVLPDGVSETFDTARPVPYRGTSLRRNSGPLGTYSRTMPRALWWS